MLSRGIRKIALRGHSASINPIVAKTEADAFR